jgi:2-polyprenyl-3-methyl-5-hydroxy-6-metoxy-1,4-benzoquinol methylase
MCKEEKDWYLHYLELYLSFSLDVDRAFVDFVSTKLATGSRIIECGSGLGRSAAALVSFGGFRVLGIDNNPNLLSLAATLNRDLVNSGSLAFAHIDFHFLSRFFRVNSFDACTHSGVLEHFPKEERAFLLREQLLISKTLFVSIPLNTEHNHQYFSKGPKTWRELKNRHEWVEEFNEHFSCVASDEVRQRTDNGFFQIEG